MSAIRTLTAAVGALVFASVVAAGPVPAEGTAAATSPVASVVPEQPLKRVDARPVTMTDAWTGVLGTPRAVLKLHGLPPGSVQLIRGYAVVGQPNQAVEAVSEKVTCGAPGHSDASQLWTGQNLVRGRPDIRLGLRLLVAVPRSGALDCVLRVMVLSHTGHRGATARLTRGWIADYGAKGRAPYATSVLLLHAPRPMATPAGPAMTLGSVARYRPRLGSKWLEVQGDVYATECHAQDNFCPAGHYRRFGRADAEVWVVATPSSPLCRPVAGQPSRESIDSSEHHHRLLASLRLATPARCGTWRLTVLARAASTSTNPFVVSTDGSYSDLAAFPVR